MEIPAEILAEARRIVAAGQSNPTTLRAFGRDFTAEEFYRYSTDFLALHRIAGNYAGQSAEDWLRHFGAEQARAQADFADLRARALPLV